MTDPSDRSTPPQDAEEWRYVWSAAKKAHAGWPFVKMGIALHSNWKVIIAFVALGIVLGGREFLEKMGLL